jgi:hypothetical protein
VISDVAAGPNFDYTIALSNSSSSDSGIGTFWFAWVPGKDFLATRPLSVTAPTGWTDIITGGGANDGFAIQFTTTNSVYYVQPGATMDFMFQSADTPQSVAGDSKFYPTTPVGTSTVYPTTEFSDSGHTFVVTPVSPPPSPPPGSTAPPLVTLTDVTFVRNRKHLVTQIMVDFSGSVNVGQADSLATYRLATQGKGGSFLARNSRMIGLRSAALDSANNEVTLTPRKPFALTKTVGLTVDGEAPSGLQDSEGRLIDGNHDGVAGGNAVAVLRPKGVTLD